MHQVLKVCFKFSECVRYVHKLDEYNYMYECVYMRTHADAAPSWFLHSNKLTLILVIPLFYPCTPVGV